MAGAGLLLGAARGGRAALPTAGVGGAPVLGMRCRGLLGSTSSPQAGMGERLDLGVAGGGGGAAAASLSPLSSAPLAILLRAAAHVQPVHARYTSTPSPIAPPTTPPMMAPGSGALDEGPLLGVVVEPSGGVAVVGRDTYAPMTFPRTRKLLNGLPVHKRKVAVKSLKGEEGEVVR